MAVPSSLTEMVTRLRECAVDDRARYLRYRQQQLLTIFNAILAHEAEFVGALEHDVPKSTFEAQLEVAVVLRELKSAFETAHFEKLTQRAATLRRSGEITSGLGSVLVIAHWTSPLATSLIPLSAAIVAGNVALTLLPPSAKATSDLLASCLYPVLDAAAYPLHVASVPEVAALVSASSFDAYAATTTDQSLREAISKGAAAASAPYTLVPHRVGRQNIAIVSKTARLSDLGDAARTLALARLNAAGGHSLGALSFVAVHEEVHEAFLTALVEAVKALVEDCPNLVVSRGLTDKAIDQKLLGAEVVLRKDRIIIASVKADSTFLHEHVLGPVLAVVPFTSTEDAFNIVAPRLGQLLAVFANSKEGEYFASELKPRLVAFNEYPLEFLAAVGPTAAGSWPPTFFERSTHAVAAPPSAPAFVPPYNDAKFAALRRLFLPRFTAAAPLVLRRKPHAGIVGRVFFLQGLFLSLGVILSTLVGMSVWGIPRLWRIVFH